MLTISSSSWQPPQLPWTLDCFVGECTIALGSALDPSTQQTYSSHLQSYLSFIKLHKFPLWPTPDTFSFFVVYMSAHIDPCSISQYLTGICHNLQYLFPDIHQVRLSPLVSHTLARCRKHFSVPVTHKSPLTPEHLCHIAQGISSMMHGELLFTTLLFCGFFGLHRLGKLVWPDHIASHSWRKVICQSSVQCTSTTFSYVLPTQKTDRFFEGNTVLIAHWSDNLNPFHTFVSYLASHDWSFTLQPALWLTASGQVPTHHWFIHRLHTTLPANVAGHSLCSGGATFFASLGWPDDRIQALGHWSSESFKIYIQKNPVLLQALLHSQASAPSLWYLSTYFPFTTILPSTILFTIVFYTVQHLSIVSFWALLGFLWHCFGYIHSHDFPKALFWPTID